MTEKKDYISMRILRSEREEFEKLAIELAIKEGRRVTLTHVLREAMYRGRPVLQAELQEPLMPGVTFVTQKTRLQDLSGLAMKALEIGFAQINSSSSSQPT